MVKGIFIHSAIFYVWNNVTKQTIWTFCRLLCILYIGSLLPVCRAACPTGNLPKTALRCFENYGAQKINLDKSDRRLFSGIDVETLRAYCSSFIQGTQCLQHLLNECPESKHSQIEIGLNALNGVEHELSQLCKTNGLYELYAQYMTCFMDRGQKSDYCFRTNLNNTRQPIYILPENQLCSRMRNTTQCIEKHVRYQCGEQAAELVHKLVMPLVKGSRQCVYDLNYIETTPKQIRTTARKGGTYRTAEQGKRETSDNNNNNKSSTCHYHNLLLTIIVFSISYLFNRRIYS